MTDRQAQARAEAVRETARYINRLHPNGPTSKAAVLADMEIAADRMQRGIHANGRDRDTAADANPQPRKVTRAGAALTDDEWKRYQRTPEQGYSHRHYVDAMIRQRLELMGIEVVDDDA